MVATVQQHGGLVSYRDNGDGSRSPYELNVTWYSALNRDDLGEPVALQVRRYIASRAIALSLMGVPGVYLPSLFGSKNDVEAVKAGAEARAINRDAIIQSLYGGAAKPANCVYVADRLVPQGIDTYSYDPEKAKQLLAEAGWDKINGDKPITILAYYTSPLVANVLAAMQAMLGQVGINIVPRAVDTPTYNSIVYQQSGNAGEFPLIFAGLQNGPDASNINIGLNEKQIPPAGANLMRIRMPEVTDALDAALAETDASKHDARYQDVCKATNANLPWGTMWVANRYGVASTKLNDFVWTPAPAGGPYQAHPEKWAIAE